MIGTPFVVLLTCALPFSTYAADLVVPIYPGTVVIDSDEQVETEKRVRRRPAKDAEERLRNGVEAVDRGVSFRPESVVIDSAAQADVERQTKVRDGNPEEVLSDETITKPAPAGNEEGQAGNSQPPAAENSNIRAEEKSSMDAEWRSEAEPTAVNSSSETPGDSTEASADAVKLDDQGANTPASMSEESCPSSSVSEDETTSSQLRSGDCRH